MYLFIQFHLLSGTVQALLTFSSFILKSNKFLIRDLHYDREKAIARCEPLYYFCLANTIQFCWLRGGILNGLNEIAIALVRYDSSFTLKLSPIQGQTRLLSNYLALIITQAMNRQRVNKVRHENFKLVNIVVISRSQITSQPEINKHLM